METVQQLGGWQLHAVEVLAGRLYHQGVTSPNIALWSPTPWQDAAERGAVAWPAALPDPSSGSKASAAAASDVELSKATGGSNGQGLPGPAGGFKGTLGQAAPGAGAGAPVSLGGTPATIRAADVSAFSIATTAGSFTEE